MKLNKKTILQGFMIFKSVYPEFEKRIQEERKGREIIQSWQEVFEAIDYNNDYINEDFINAVKIAVSKSKYVPTIAEILEEIKTINARRFENNKILNTKEEWQ